MYITLSQQVLLSKLLTSTLQRDDLPVLLLPVVTTTKGPQPGAGTPASYAEVTSDASCTMVAYSGGRGFKRNKDHLHC
jgi:hypothetical protein